MKLLKKSVFVNVDEIDQDVNEIGTNGNSKMIYHQENTQ